MFLLSQTHRSIARYETTRAQHESAVNELVAVVVDDETVNRMVDQEGQLVDPTDNEPDDGRVYMSTGTVGNVVNNIINMQNVDEASSFTMQDGEIILE